MELTIYFMERVIRHPNEKGTIRAINATTKKIRKATEKEKTRFDCLPDIGPIYVPGSGVGFPEEVVETFDPRENSLTFETGWEIRELDSCRLSLSLVGPRLGVIKCYISTEKIRKIVIK
ncbi:MAG: hypothetical protein AAB453_00695 [Patescibacteria group bacterium]